MNKTTWFYIFMITTIVLSASGGAMAFIYNKDLLAGVLWGYVAGGGVSMLSQIKGVVTSSLVIAGIGLAGLLSGCGAQKPKVDVPCLATCALQAATCAAGCVGTDGAAVCPTSEEVAP